MNRVVRTLLAVSVGVFLGAMLASCGGDSSVHKGALNAAGVPTDTDTNCTQVNEAGATNNTQDCGSGQIGNNTDTGNTQPTTTNTNNCTASDHSQGKC